MSVSLETNPVRPLGTEAGLRVEGPGRAWPAGMDELPAVGLRG